MHVLNGLVAVRGVGGLRPDLGPAAQNLSDVVVNGGVVKADVELVSALEASSPLGLSQLLQQLPDNVVCLLLCDAQCLLPCCFLQVHNHKDGRAAAGVSAKK